jgi:acyl carrier protein phosphodiesterase
MNFLSHFYFERNNPDHNMVIGVVLPDLVKNADKDWNLNPQREEALFAGNETYQSILKGWNKHIEVDRLFHGSEFFKVQTGIIKQMILPAVLTGPVKPFFLAHIALELVLDHLLVAAGEVNVNTYYSQLSKSNTSELESFLLLAGMEDIERFNRFLNSYITSKYMLSYQKAENITYALNRICMRLWREPFTEPQLLLLTKGIAEYIKTIEKDFLQIFREMEGTASMKAF